MHLLVTTGGTVTFKALVRFVVTTEFMDLVHSLGFTKLSVQYGNEITKDTHISKQFINSCFVNCKYLQDHQLESTAAETSVVLGGLQIEWFPYSHDLDSYIILADVIISHGGTGTIIDILKKPCGSESGKPVIVVYNDQLMDNHQLEIANQFKILNHCVPIASSQLSVETIAPIMTQLLDGTVTLAPYVPSNTSILQSILVHELQATK